MLGMLKPGLGSIWSILKTYSDQNLTLKSQLRDTSSVINQFSADHKSSGNSQFKYTNSILFYPAQVQYQVMPCTYNGRRLLFALVGVRAPVAAYILSIGGK